MHPGPMNRGVEIASDVADGAALGDPRAGRPAASRCAWRCSTCSPDRARRRRVSDGCLIRGGRVIDPSAGARRRARPADRGRRASAQRRRADRGRPRTPRCSTPPAWSSRRAHRHPRPPARAGAGVQGDGRAPAPRRRRPAASPPSPAWRTPSRSNDSRSVTEHILRRAPSAPASRGSIPIGAVSKGLDGRGAGRDRRDGRRRRASPSRTTAGR